MCLNEEWKRFAEEVAPDENHPGAKLMKAAFYAGAASVVDVFFSDKEPTTEDIESLMAALANYLADGNTH